VGVPDDPISERGYPVLKQEAIAQGQWEIAADHAITHGVEAALLPSAGEAGRFYRYRAAGDVLVRAAGLPVVAVKSYGKGRVVAFAQVGDGLIPDPVDPVKTRTYWDYWEYQYSLFARAVRWAAGREADLQIASLRASEDGGLTVELIAKGPRAVDVEVSAKSEFGLALGSRHVRRDVPAGSSTVVLAASLLSPEAGWPGGRQILDVIVRDPATAATLDWGAATFDVPKPATVASIKTSAEVYRRGDLMSVVARAAGRLEDLRLRLTLSDDLGRVLHVEEKRTPERRTSFRASTASWARRSSSRPSWSIPAAGSSTTCATRRFRSCSGSAGRRSTGASSRSSRRAIPWPRSASAGCVRRPWTAGSPGAEASRTASRSRAGTSASTGTTAAPPRPKASSARSRITSARATPPPSST
jgi:hypothetical protein